MWGSTVAVVVLVCVVVVASGNVDADALWRVPGSTTSLVRQRNEWVVVDDNELGATTQLRLFLRAEKSAELRSAFLRASDPRSPHYAAYLSPEQLCALVRPRPQRRHAIDAFLVQHALRVTGESRCNDVLTVSGTRAAVERAFSTRLQRFRLRSDATTSVVAAADDRGFAVPAALADSIELVHGLHLPVVVAPRAAPLPSSLSSASYADATPPILAKLYGLPTTPAVNVSVSRASQAVAGWQHQSYSEFDLRHFQRVFGLPQTPIRSVFGRNTGFPHMESNLDTQYISSLGGIPTDFYLNSGFSFDVLDWANEILNQTASADVHSVSYGEDLSMRSVAYAQRVDSDFQKLGLLGKTVLVASGDTGARSRQSLGFAAEFPAALPSCTAVGATVLNADFTETQCVSCSYGWCSGGGFAYPSYFPLNTTAPWQLAAVQRYLNQSGLPPPSKWAHEAGGAGFPDVAVVGTQHKIYYYDLPTEVAGTSSSCPSFAAMVSRLNHERGLRGKRPLGFLNPLLYGNPQLFNDIQQGNTGWPATPGWDATTGVGTPRYPALLQYVLNLP